MTNSPPSRLPTPMEAPMCSCPAHLRLVDCVCECDHTGDRLTQLNDRRSELEAEVDRLRSALTALSRNEQAACNRSLELQEENKRIRAEATGTALGHLAKIERLQTQRDALVRKLGLDWGPDEFGDLDSLPTEGSTDRSEMLSDLQWYTSDLGPEHWQNCDVGDEDCYLCAGHVAIRDRWKGVK